MFLFFICSFLTKKDFEFFCNRKTKDCSMCELTPDAFVKDLFARMGKGPESDIRVFRKPKLLSFPKCEYNWPGQEKKECNKFRFLMSNGLEKRLPEGEVSSVTFQISRYGMYSKTLVFNGYTMSVEETIEHVHFWFSQQATWDYYLSIENDLTTDYENEAELLEKKVTRGELFSEGAVLEDVNLQNGHATLTCGF